MHVAALCLDLRLPQCRSLKDKRAVLRPVLAGARQRFWVAVAEVGHQDLHQRSLLAMAAVASSASQVSEVLDSVERWIWSRPDLEVIASERSWMES